MNDADAAQPAARALIEEFHKQSARFLDDKTVQVQLRLYHPVATAQFSEGLGADTVTGKGKFITGLQAGVPGNGVAEAVRQDLLIVAQALCRHRARQRALVLHSFRAGQRRHIPHRGAEQVDIIGVNSRPAGFFHRKSSGQAGRGGFTSARGFPGTFARRAPPCNRSRRW
ncbi:hypothetical protein D3C83_02250 [compost metagenome]